MIYKYGLDFGTTNSSIAIRYAEEDETEHTIVVDLKDQYPKETLPSLICITETGDVFVGLDAKEQYSILRAQGKKAELIREIKMQLEKYGRNLSYTVGDTVYSGIDLIATLLRYLRQRAEKEAKLLGVEVSGVVMGVPVQFLDVQKDILKEALVKAGFYKDMREAERCTEFVSEPVAVAVHYGLKTTDNKKVLVFDFGGGTLDLAVVNLKDQVGIDHLHPHDVICKDRMTLGGEALTKQFFIETFCGRSGYGLHKILDAFHFDNRLTAEELWERIQQNYSCNGLVDAIDQCKCELSTAKYYNFSFLGPTGISLGVKKIYRDYFEESIDSYIMKINEFIDHCLEEGGIEDQYEIDHVLIAGGSSLIPCVQELLRTKFGKVKVLTNPGKFGSSKGNWNTKTPETEVLTSIVRGLAAIGCRKETLIEDVVDSDYGFWDDVKNRFVPVITKGMTVMEASRFDPISSEGIYREIKPQFDDMVAGTLSIYQRSVAGQVKLGAILFKRITSKRYKVFMHIDPKQGKLLVDVTSGKTWEKIPLDQKEYTISK